MSGDGGGAGGDVELGAGDRGVVLVSGPAVGAVAGEHRPGGEGGAAPETPGACAVGAGVQLALGVLLVRMAMKVS